MARDTQLICYFLARLVANIDDVSVEEEFQKAEAFFKATAPKHEPKDDGVSEEDVEAIYKAYPTKDDKTGASTNKCSKQKDTIRRLLRTRSKESILKAMDDYLFDCRLHNRYLKNFSTFLNNIPDEETPKSEEEENFLQGLVDQRVTTKYQQ